MESRVESAMQCFSMAAEQYEDVERVDPMDQIASLTPYTYQAPSSPSKPRCRPWSQADYIARLRTFSPKTWFGKPLSASPPECARHGWINESPDTLKCQCCEAVLTVQADLDGTNAASTDVSKGHGEYCPWRNNPCPTYITLFPVMTPEAVKAALLSRFGACIAMINHYHKRLGVEVPEELTELLSEEDGKEGGKGDISLSRLARYLSEAASKASSSSRPSPASRGGGSSGGGAAAAAPPVATGAEVDEELIWATVLALYGWEPSRQLGARREETVDMGWTIHCSMCGRGVAVWPLVSHRLMESDDRSKARRVDGEGPKEATATFHPVNEHRWYCPWISRTEASAAAASTTEGRLPGWRYSASTVVRHCLLAQDPTTKTAIETTNTSEAAIGEEKVAGGDAGAQQNLLPENLFKAAMRVLDRIGP